MPFQLDMIFSGGMRHARSGLTVCTSGEISGWGDPASVMCAFVLFVLGMIFG